MISGLFYSVISLNSKKFSYFSWIVKIGTPSKLSKKINCVLGLVVFTKFTKSYFFESNILQISSSTLDASTENSSIRTVVNSGL